MKKWLLRIFFVLIVLCLVVLIFGWRNMRDRHPGYTLDVKISNNEPGPLRVGFSALPITPKIVETWIDKNNDAKFKASDGDSYLDKNKNGKFDAYWIAGFGNARAANGVHDDLWARAIVLDDSRTRIALVVLDAIGFFHDDVVDVRQLIPESSGVDYTLICSTHDHEGPDLLGLWGSSFLKSGVNPEHMKYVKKQAAAAVVEASSRLRPAKLKFTQDLSSAIPLVMDSRKPIVLDPGLRILQAIDAEADTTLGSLVAWGDHPETLWSDNLLISSDYPHYLRESIEKGVGDQDHLLKAGLGGICVFFNGAIGGLMTTKPGLKITDPVTKQTYSGATFEKIQAQGKQLALIALNALDSPDTVVITQSAIRLRAKTIRLPVVNKYFRLGGFLGILNRGFTGWMKTRTEIAAFQIGPAGFLSLPGEVYPEIIQGGIESPAGQDFPLQPVEIPPLRQKMPGGYKFIIGLANDEIGYIIPKSEWDTRAPYIYGAKGSPYGEVNSLGPDTAPLLHQEALKILGEL